MTLGKLTTNQIYVHSSRSTPQTSNGPRGTFCISTVDGYKYSGTSLVRSPTGLVKSGLNGEVTLLQGVICTLEYTLGLSHGDCNGEVFLLVR